MNKSGSQRRVPRLAVDSLTSGLLELSLEQAHYVRDVLGLAVDYEVVLFDTASRQANARIVEVSRAGVVLQAEAPRATPLLACALTVGLAVPKGERADWAVEKLTEVGVSRIVWLLCEHSVVKPERAGARQDCYVRLARAAASQCGRCTLPELDGPLPLAELLATEAELRLIGSPGGEPLPGVMQRHQARSAVLTIGPEGGFSAQELALAQGAGYTAVSLGPHTLRVETAAVVGAAMVLGGATQGEQQRG